MVQIRQQLGGVILEGHNEPAYSLVDECCFQYETRCLRYVEPAKCASREAEVTSGKLNKKLHLDGSSLTVKESKNIPDESVNNAYQLMLCFRRRAVAYEFSGLISYRSHERYTDSLMRHLQQDPPPNFHSTSITQVLRADKEVFSYLSKHCDNIRPDAAGVKPLDNMLMEALRDYHVAFHLMPLPQSASAQQRREPSDTKTSPSAPYPARPQKGKGKGKQKKRTWTYDGTQRFSWMRGQRQQRKVTLLRLQHQRMQACCGWRRLQKRKTQLLSGKLFPASCLERCPRTGQVSRYN